MLYATGAARNKRDAALIAGITPVHFTNMSNMNPETKRLINNVQQMVEDESITTSKLLQTLGRKAVGRLAQLMDSPNDTVAFRAAQDLADRSTETQKTQRVQMESLTLSGEDAKALAAAMVESSRAQVAYEHVGRDGLVEVSDMEASVAQLKLVSSTDVE